MAGTGRPRGRPRKQAAEPKTPTKPTRGRKKKIISSDEEGDDSRSVNYEEDGKDGDSPAEPVDKGPSPAKKNKSLGSQWVSIKAEEEDAEVPSMDEEEEDELPDEGEEVESDIEKLNSSPDYVAFTRPSTSPVRGRTGITLRTPPTPSPTKHSKKRQAPPSPEVNEVNSDDEDYVQEPVTPAKGRKARVKKTIKSEEFIEDSDVEEHETSANKKPVKSKASAKKKDVVSKKSPAASVKILDKKIVVRGSKFPNTPIEDADNNMFLDGGSPLPKSPKKKQKTSHVPESDQEESDGDVPLGSLKSKGPETPSVGKLTKRLDASVLDSAKKPNASTRDVFSDPHLRSIATAMELVPVKQYFCRLLADTYGNVSPTGLHGINICSRTGDFTWFTLKAMFVKLSIAPNTKQESDIISLVTAPSIASFIHNPARSNFANFELLKQTGREFIVPASTMKKSCFVVYGIVRESHLTELSFMGSSDWLNKRVEIYPLTADFVLAYNFFTNFLDVKGLSVFRDYVSIGTYPIGKNKVDPGNYQGTDSAPAPRKTGPTIHNLRADEDEEDLLFEVLKQGIEGGGLEANATVPVFNLGSYYGCTSQPDLPHSLDTFVAVCARAGRFAGEIPRDSLVAAFVVPSRRAHKEESHSDLQLNLVGAVLIAAPYGQGIGSF